MTFHQLQLIEITSDTSQDIKTIAMGSDQLHVISSLDELNRCRIGGLLNSKRAFALVADEREVASVIFVRQGAQKLLQIRPILDEESKLVDQIRQQQFYCVTTVKGTHVNNAGYNLIQRLKPYLEEEDKELGRTDVRRDTISPLREFSAFLRDKGILNDKFENYSKDARTALVIEHLVKGHKKEHARNLHLGKCGSFVSEIFLNAAQPGTPDGDLGAGVMIEFGYNMTADEMATNLARYKGGELPASGHLEALVREEIAKRNSGKTAQVAIGSPSLQAT